MRNHRLCPRKGYTSVNAYKEASRPNFLDRGLSAYEPLHAYGPAADMQSRESQAGTIKRVRVNIHFDDRERWRKRERKREGCVVNTCEFSRAEVGEGRVGRRPRA